MIKYFFEMTKEDEGTGKLKNVSFDTHGVDSLDEILAEFLNFLKASGWEFDIDDKLKIVNPDENTKVSITPFGEAVLKALQDTSLEEDKSEEVFADDVADIKINVSESATDTSRVVDFAQEDWLTQSKLNQVADTIIPFLESLKRDPEKIMIRWPNRANIIDEHLNKIKNIIGE